MSIQVLMEHKCCKLQKITAPHLATVSAVGASVTSQGNDLVATTCNLVLVTLWMFASCRERVYSIRFWHILMTKYIAWCICGVIKQNLTIITIGTDLRSGMPIYMKVFNIAYGELSHIVCCHITGPVYILATHSIIKIPIALLEYRTHQTAFHYPVGHWTQFE